MQVLEGLPVLDPSSLVLVMGVKCISCDCNGSKPQNEILHESETDVSFSLVLVCSGRICGINFESLIQMEKVKFNVE